ncbi:protein NYNRIN-like [Mercenaria mercenaria]|uniref:protein NYNRIN-like n=1 Tax=Mercenaria mercenaria TaxID=6596 RepID=UPI00234F8070|nr:protein NYNRIN-like [Mercenaria mercenaria]
MLSVSTCPTKPGTCNGRDVIAMRDTGCTCVIVKRDLVEASQFLEKTRRCKYIDGSEHRLDVARIDIDCPYFKGTVEALVVDNPTNDVIIGNVEGAVEPQFSSLASAVETRAQAKVKKQVKLKVPSQILDVSREEFLEKQQNDSTLDLCRKKAEESTIKQCRGKGSVRFEIRNRLLYREYTAQNLDKSRQLIVPKCLRETVMKVAHDSLLSGHLGIRKTSDRVLGEFYWPGVMAEVRRYCQSCSICQRTIAKGRVSKVPLGKMPLIDTPFKRVAVDIVGPIEPMTDRKNRYILTMVDYATRYPEAIALPSIETERVAEALVDMYSRLGVPEEMLTDCGSQFTSDRSKSIPDKGILSKVGAAIVEEDQRDYDRLDPNESSDEFSSRVEKDIVLCPIKQGTEAYKDVEVNPELPVECKQEVVDLLDNFSKVLTDIYFVCVFLLIFFKFISNVGAIAVPLTDLTKKGQPNLVEWGESQEKAFQTLKASLMGPPILKLPDLDQTFILRVDASDLGLGSVLLQESDGEKLPVAYASRKLLPREQKYSVIEKECLAIVWAVAKFHRYLFGKDFVLETDHQPLTYLNKAKLSNSRLMRWALALQPYRISIRAIPGRENVGADYLSRV